MSSENQSDFESNQKELSIEDRSVFPEEIGKGRGDEIHTYSN